MKTNMAKKQATEPSSSELESLESSTFSEIFLPLFLATGLIREEMSEGTIHYMLAKPIARGRYYFTECWDISESLGHLFSLYVSDYVSSQVSQVQATRCLDGKMYRFGCRLHGLRC